MNEANTKNIKALASRNKELTLEIEKTKEELIHLKSLISQLTLEVQQCKSMVQINRVMGSTSN